jgi:hypothetical protein
MKRIAGLLTLVFLATFMPLNAAVSAVRSGAICTKQGQSIVSANKKFTCVKVGNKLKWKKGVTNQSAKPAAATSVHEKVISQVISDWKVWRTKSTASSNQVRIIVEPGYESNWSVGPARVANLLINTLEGNNHTLLQEPIALLGDNKEWILSTGKTLSCGTVDLQQPLGIYCGHIQMGYGYFIINGNSTDKFATGKKLSPSQNNALKFSIAHDVATMYELQAQYGSIKYDGTKNQIPAWIREGFVQLFAALAASEITNPKQNYVDFMTSSGLLEQFPRALCTKTLQEFESKDRNWGGSCIYSQNFYGVELLAARHGGLEALFNFVALFGETDDWPSSFKNAFGISREDFYVEWYDYLGIAKSGRPAMKSAAPSIHS